VKHFYDLADWDDVSVLRMIGEARAYKKGAPAPQFPRATAVFVFLNPSLRTRVSLEVACRRLGIQSLVVQPGADAWRLEWRDGVEMSGEAQEHLEEAAGVLSRFANVIGVRAFPGGRNLKEDLSDPIVTGFMRASSVPVINLESAMFHPLQGLADWMTLYELFGEPEGKKVVLTWTYHPRAVPLAVSHSFLTAAARAGCRLVLAHPPEFPLAEDVIRAVERFSREAKGSFEMTGDQEEAFSGAHLIYAKSWASLLHYGDPEAEREVRERYRDWKVTAKKMERTERGYLMHCLPVRRNVEVDEEVLKSANSAVLQQAENRLWTAMAVLKRMVEPE
jgi:N-acetylornithine carbamoyltransferase